MGVDDLSVRVQFRCIRPPARAVYFCLHSILLKARLSVCLSALPSTGEHSNTLWCGNTTRQYVFFGPLVGSNNCGMPDRVSVWCDRLTAPLSPESLVYKLVFAQVGGSRTLDIRLSSYEAKPKGTL